MSAIENTSSSARRDAFSTHARNPPASAGRSSERRARRRSRRAGNRPRPSSRTRLPRSGLTGASRYNMGVVLGGANLAGARVRPRGCTRAVLRAARGRASRLARPASPGARAITSTSAPPAPNCGRPNATASSFVPARISASSRRPIHPKTRRPYRWLEGYEPWTLDPLPLPEHIVAFFGERLPNQRQLPNTETETCPTQRQTCPTQRV